MKITPPQRGCRNAINVGHMFFSYENNHANLGIEDVDSGYVCTNIYIYDYYLDNNEWRAQRHSQENVIKGYRIRSFINKVFYIWGGGWG